MYVHPLALHVSESSPCLQFESTEPPDPGLLPHVQIDRGAIKFLLAVRPLSFFCRCHFQIEVCKECIADKGKGRKYDGSWSIITRR